MRAGCRIFEYHKSILHAKTLVVDDWAMVGTSNFNHRSFLFDLEVDAALQTPAARRVLDRRFALDLGRCREVRASDHSRRPNWVRALTGIFFRLRHWL